MNLDQVEGFWDYIDPNLFRGNLFRKLDSKKRNLFVGGQA